MHDKIFDFAKDPSCILAVTPDNGGSWVAPLRPNRPRNFAERPMTWTELSNYLRTVGDDDFRLTIKWSDLTPGKVLQASYAFLGIQRLSDTAYIFATPPVSSEGKGEVFYAVRKQPNNTVVFTRARGYSTIEFNGVLIRRKVSSAVSVSSDTDWQSKFNGTISELCFENLTTGATVWEAPHSELYETNNPWPSTAPRNFATVTSTEVGSRLTGSFTRVQKTSADCTIKRLSVSVPGYRRFDYPSEAERIRLLTYDNVRTDRGVFERASLVNAEPYFRWAVKTPLIIYGKGGEWTFLSRVKLSEATSSGSDSLFFGQGQQYYATECTVGHTFLRDGSGINFIASFNDDNWRKITYTFPFPSVNEWHDTALVVDFNSHVMIAYIDGIEIGRSALNESWTCFGSRVASVADGTVPFVLGQTVSGYKSLVKMTHALVFDRALKPAEIAAISQC